MRTTIEMKDEHRAALLELAARRRQKGFSVLVGEAIESYLKFSTEKSRKRRAAMELRGKLSAEEARRLRKETSNLRKSWR